MVDDARPGQALSSFLPFELTPLERKNGRKRGRGGEKKGTGRKMEKLKEDFRIKWWSAPSTLVFFVVERLVSNFILDIIPARSHVGTHWNKSQNPVLYVSRYLRRAYRKIARERKGKGEKRELFEDRSLSQRVCFHASNGSRDARVRPESWENLFLLSNIYVGTKRVPRE